MLLIFDFLILQVNESVYELGQVLINIIRIWLTIESARSLISDTINWIIDSIITKKKSKHFEKMKRLKI